MFGMKVLYILKAVGFPDWRCRVVQKGDANVMAIVVNESLLCPCRGVFFAYHAYRP